MAGLFGLFGGNSKDGNSEAFYLSSDDAKTFGDIEYMRGTTEVKKTFPKVNGKEIEVPKPVEKVAKQVMQSKSFPTSASTPESPNTERRSADSSMDEFRKMVRDMKKS